ncbi:MAG: outer membrane protein assembly factor BamB [Gammaproteobacteria bacterium HGW-Gammaproteobacteria-3]|nr:MAG: outer membrane protein assembly factor BamB [Gammaproteobacteria bacterium HGW-Gammaproteobacteria-3]
MRLFLTALLVLGLSGCAAVDAVKDLTNSFFGGEDNSDPPNELVEYKPEVVIEKLWRETVGDGADEKFLKLVPAIADETVFAADSAGLVEAFELNGGRQVWEAETEEAFSGGPGVNSGTIILGTRDAAVIALNPANGDRLWRATVSSEVLAIPVLAEALVVVRTTDGRIIALNAADGSTAWAYELSVPALSIRGSGAPLVIEEKVIAGFANGKLVALRLADGKHLWETSIAIPGGRSEIERLVDLDVDPVANDGVIFIASYQGGASAVLVPNGEVIWRNPDISSYTGMSYDTRYLYISDNAGDVWQVDQRNGAALWKQSDLHQRKLSAPLVYDEFVVVGDFEGYLHWLSKTDGRQLGRLKIADAAITAQPIAHDDVIYVYAQDGTLAALKARF